jgi:hypothetical protein
LDSWYYWTPTPAGGEFPLSWDYCDSYSLGVGIDYYLRLGVGATFKHIVSEFNNSAYLSTGGGNSLGATIMATSHAADFGLLVDVPLIHIIAGSSGEPLTIASGITPIADIHLAYTRENVGPEIRYFDQSQVIHSHAPRRSGWVHRLDSRRSPGSLIGSSSLSRFFTRQKTSLPAWIHRGLRSTRADWATFTSGMMAFSASSTHRLRHGRDFSSRLANSSHGGRVRLMWHGLPAIQLQDIVCLWQGF